MKSLKSATLALALAAAVTGPLACQRSAEQPEQSQGELGQEGAAGSGETVAPAQIPSEAPEGATSGTGTGMEAIPGQSDTVAPTEVPTDDSSMQEEPAEAPSGGGN